MICRKTNKSGLSHVSFPGHFHPDTLKLFGMGDASLLTEISLLSKREALEIWEEGNEVHVGRIISNKKSCDFTRKNVEDGRVYGLRINDSITWHEAEWRYHRDILKEWEGINVGDILDGTSFQVGKFNDRQAIESLSAWPLLPRVLRRMRSYSTANRFLNESDDLIKLLLEDREEFTRLNVTPQVMGDWFDESTMIARGWYNLGNNHKPFLHSVNGKKLVGKVTNIPAAYQEPPLPAVSLSRADFLIAEPDTNASIRLTEMAGDLTRNWGFMQRLGGYYRINPIDAVKVYR